jgi:methionyl-tRNA formyltransferase
MVNIMFVGNVPPQSDALLRELIPYKPLVVREDRYLEPLAVRMRPSLIIVGGWRRLIPPSVLRIPYLGVVGFHSAKLPEYPGRAPVPWALLRGDTETANTMLFLDEGVDSGDIIDSRIIPITPTTSPIDLYMEMARTGVEMLREHLPALLDGKAPRQPQDPSLRGPLTTKDGWQRWYERCAL